MEDTSVQPTPQLLTEIQFNPARKGYDPGEVDAFLERLSAAVTQMQDKLRQSAAAAQDAQRQAAEAVRAKEVLQARVDELESGATFAPVAEDVSPELEAEQAAAYGGDNLGLAADDPAAGVGGRQIGHRQRCSVRTGHKFGLGAIGISH